MELQNNKKLQGMGAMDAVEMAEMDIQLQEIRKEIEQNPEMKRELEQRLGLLLMQGIYICQLLGTTLDQFMKEHPMEEFEDSFKQMMECADGCCDEGDEDRSNHGCGCC
jgi:hypothetical protein